MKIDSPEQMHEYGKTLAQEYKTLLLTWDLWAGKTTLIKGFAEALGIDPSKVQSPTYAYLNSYDSKLLHIDMYRLESYDELLQKGILDQFAEHEYIVIERPKWIEQLDLDWALHLYIHKISAWSREIQRK